MVTERETQGGRCLTTPWSGVVWQVVGPIAGVGGRAPEAGKDPRQRVRHNRLNDRSTASCPSRLERFEISCALDSGAGSLTVCVFHVLDAARFVRRQPTSWTLTPPSTSPREGLARP